MTATEVSVEELEQEKQAVWDTLLTSKIGSKSEKILKEKYVDVCRKIRRAKGV